jgi:hypothetical protein
MEDVKEYIKQIKKYISEEDGSVGNVTSNVDGYNIPGAFAASEEEHEKRMDIISRAFGYVPVKKKKPKYFIPVHKQPLKQVKKESVFQEFASHLHLNEVRYSDFKKDETLSNSKKINVGIKKINRSLYELESFINQHSKLKNEMNITNDLYWKSSKKKLHKIAERLIKISKKIIELSA